MPRVALRSLLPLLWVAASCSKHEAPTQGQAPAPRPSVPAPGASSAAGSAASGAPAEAPACPEDMRSIQGGTFRPDGAERQVRVDGFCLDTTEVTVAAYRECTACTAPDRLGSACNWGEPKRDDHPVNCVTFAQAEAYCRALKKRLPTEEEWELAASGREEQTYPWGSAPPAGQLCWHRGHVQAKPGHNREGTCPVGSFPSGRSPYGVEDMAGNVREWTASDYDAHKKPDEPSRPGARVVRGSDWGQDKPTRNGLRSWAKPTDHFDDLGFRCAR